MLFLTFWRLGAVFCIMDALDGAVFTDAKCKKRKKEKPAHFVLSNQRLCCFVVMRVRDCQCAESGTELPSQLGFRPHSQR